MHQPTCVNLRVRTPLDAHTIFHAVHEGILPMVTRRLDTEERRAISSGCVYVWEERGASAEATGMGIERWTDSIQWGPSRVRDEFLFYAERREPQGDVDFSPTSDSSDSMMRQRRRGFYRQPLTKQTYSVYVETPRGQRKWHMIAYFVPDSIHLLRTIDDIPILSMLRVPRGMYYSARTPKSRPQNGRLRSASFPGRPQFPSPPTPPLLSGGGGSTPHGAATLAPLAYLNRLPPPRRHVMDEMALNSFTGAIAPDGFQYRSHL